MDRWVDAGLLSVVLIAAAVCDWRTGKVPNVLTYPAVLVGFLWWGLSGWIAVWPAGSGLAAGLALTLFGRETAVPSTVQTIFRGFWITSDFSVF